MTRTETLKARYGEDYFRRLAKQVKHRKGFQDRSKEEIRAAQLKGAKMRGKKKHADQETTAQENASGQKGPDSPEGARAIEQA